MDAIACIKTRRTVRAFTDATVSPDVLSEIVSMAAYVPSWKNTQIARYTAILDKEKLKNLANDAFADFQHNQGIVRGTPALVVLSYVEGRCGYERDGSFSTKKGDRWQMFDCGIAAEAFCLLAHEKGLGTCIMGIFDEDAIAAAVDLPDTEKVAAVIAVGYPAETPVAPPKKGSDILLRVKE